MSTALQRFVTRAAPLLGFSVTFENKPAEQRVLNYINDPLGNPKNSLNDFVDYETGSSSGTLSARTALSLSTVYACVKIIAEDISTCDLIVETKRDGHWYPDEEHYLNGLLQTPSWSQTLQSIRESYIGNAALTGNGISPIRRDDRTGRVVEIVSKEYNEIYIFRAANNRERVWYYVVDEKGRSDLLSDSQVIHLKNFSLDGREGLSPIAYQSQSISVGLNAVRYAQDNFGSGGFGGGFVETQGTMEPARRLRFSKQIRQAQAMGLPPVLVEGTKFVPNKISPKDVDLVETLKWSKEDVASTYRVPAHMLGFTGAQSGTSREQDGIYYVTHCLRPWARKEENELERKFLTPKERNTTRIRVDLSSLSRGDMAATASYLSTMISSRVMVPNEARRHIGLPPTDWGDAPVDNQKSAAEMNGHPTIHTMKNGNHEE